MVDQNVFRLDAVHPGARGSRPVVLPPPKAKAVSLRKYEPTVLDGEPTPVTLRMEVDFHG
jgi:hypothetical protein